MAPRTISDLAARDCSDMSSELVTEDEPGILLRTRSSVSWWRALKQLLDDDAPSNHEEYEVVNEWEQ